jgi:ABC-type polysaccharide/polyol phosphate export permease
MTARNADTLLGRVWNLLNPLLFGLIYFLLVTIIRGRSGGLEVLADILANLYLWLFFSAAIVQGVSSTVGTSALLTQSSVPRAVLPIASTWISSQILLRSMGVYAFAHLLAGRRLHFELLVVPIVVLAVATAGLGLALLLAVLNLYVRDVSRLLGHMLRLWMYLSPVVWHFREAENYWFVKLNPLFHAVKTWTLALSGSGEATLWPSLAITIAFSAAALLGGLLLFVSRDDEFATQS